MVTCIICGDILDYKGNSTKVCDDCRPEFEKYKEEE